MQYSGLGDSVQYSGPGDPVRELECLFAGMFRWMLLAFCVCVYGSEMVLGISQNRVGLRIARTMPFAQNSKGAYHTVL